MVSVRVSGRPSPLHLLPPLECLRFFDAAARHQSFVRAAAELQVTPAAVAYRVKMLEDHLGHVLFDRTRRGVVLNPRGTACLEDVQRILTNVRDVIDRYRNAPQMRRLNIVAVESIAEQWIMPHLATFTAAWPDIAIAWETDHLGVDPNRQDFDIWITYSGGTRAPSPEMAIRETLFEAPLVPVCSPALLKARGRPRTAVDLHTWPLLYHVDWPAIWAHWFEAHGDPPPDLSNAPSFRLCSMVAHAAMEGMGVALGLQKLMARELREGLLVPLFDWHDKAHIQCHLMATAAALHKPEVQAFREWIFQLSATERLGPTTPTIPASSHTYRSPAPA